MRMSLIAACALSGDTHTSCGRRALSHSRGARKESEIKAPRGSASVRWAGSPDAKITDSRPLVPFVAWFS